jgi:hypothetical protein
MMTTKTNSHPPPIVPIVLTEMCVDRACRYSMVEKFGSLSQAMGVIDDLKKEARRMEC